MPIPEVTVGLSAHIQRKFILIWVIFQLYCLRTLFYTATKKFLHSC